MDRHERVVLEQRVRPEPLRRSLCGHEGVGGPSHEAEEERCDDKEDEGGVADHRVISQLPVAPHEDARHDREDEAPQENRPGQCRPHAGHRVEQRRDGAVVLGHEHEREVVGDERVLHGARGEEGAHEDHRCQQPGVGCRPLRRRRRSGVSERCGVPDEPPAGDEPDDAHDDPGEAGQEGEPDPYRPRNWRPASADRAGCRHLHPVRILGDVGARVLDQNGVRDEGGGRVRREVPHHDDRHPGPEERRRAARVGDVDYVGTLTNGEVRTAPVGWMVPGTTVPSSRNVWVPSECLLARA